MIFHPKDRVQNTISYPDFYSDHSVYTNPYNHYYLLVMRATCAAALAQ